MMSQTPLEAILISKKMNLQIAVRICKMLVQFAL